MIPNASLRTAVARCLLAVTLVPGCSQRVLTPELYAPDKVPTTAAQHPVLKVHMKSGELYTLDSWRVVADGRRLEGTGTRYSLRREPLGEGPASIAVDDVALFETNRPENVGAGGAAALAVMTTVTGTVAAFCVASPKSCFGSCPTFYVEGEGDQRPLAEGFSASIARALEARDVDALRTSRKLGSRLALTMRNEAFETPQKDESPPGLETRGRPARTM